MKKKLLTGFTTFIMLSSIVGMANAGLIINLVGDKDCFGLGGTCPDGSLYRDQLGGTFFEDNRDVSDPTFTDIWAVDAAITYGHSYSLGGETATSAELEIRTAGLADNRGPYDVFFNGTDIGEFPTDTFDSFQKVTTHIFPFSASLLTLSDTILLNINVPDEGDGFSIDYSELRISTDSAPIPEPATMILFGTGIAGLIGTRIRRKKN